MRANAVVFRISLGIALSFGLTGAARAADPGAIELRATAEKLVVTTGEDGVERTELVKPEIVVPGDKIAYTIAARNVSGEVVQSVVITDPIPGEMALVPGTEAVSGANVLFSVDGGKRFDRADRLTVLGADGRPRPAISNDFTHIRWIFETPLAPAAERSVRFVALVE